MQTKVVLPTRLMKEIDEIGPQFGFKNENEFVQEAVKEKILELKKWIFTSITDKIKLELEQKKITPELILKDFESKRNENYRRR